MNNRLSLDKQTVQFQPLEMSDGIFVTHSLSLGCLTSLQHTSVSHERSCSDHCTFCHTDIEVTDQTFYLTQSQFTDTGPTGPSDDRVTPGACQDSHQRGQFLSHWYDSTRERKRESNPGSSALEADTLTTRPKRRYTASGPE